MLDQDGLKVTAMVSVLRPSGLKYSHRLLLPGKSRLGLATEWIEIGGGVIPFPSFLSRSCDRVD